MRLPLLPGLLFLPFAILAQTPPEPLASGQHAHGQPSFETQLPIPAVPTHILPEDNAVHVKLDAPFTWNPQPSASDYHYQLATDAAFTRIVKEDSTANTSVLDNAYLLSTVYYRRVRARNSTGSSDWSAVFSFTTLPPPPFPPNIEYPKAYVTNVPLSPIATWRPTANTDSYRVTLTGYSTLDSTLAIPPFTKTVTDTSALLGPLIPSVIYSLTLTAYNSVDSSGKITTMFKTVPPIPPMPVLAKPFTHSGDLAANPILTWLKAPHAHAYRLQLSTTADFSARVLDTILISDTTFTPKNLANDGKYFWRVAAANQGGNSAYSTPWDFTIIVGLPSPLVLLQPAKGETLKADSLRVTWRTGIAKVDRYWVEVSRDSAYTDPIIDSAVTDTSKVLAFGASSGTFWWRVKAHNAAGWGAFSEKGWFEVKATTTVLSGSISRIHWNPGNGRLAYSLPKAEFVSIRIYGPIGKLVAMPMNGRQGAGAHTISLSRELRTPGLYLLSFRAGDNFREERFLLGN